MSDTTHLISLFMYILALPLETKQLSVNMPKAGSSTNIFTASSIDSEIQEPLASSSKG